MNEATETITEIISGKKTVIMLSVINCALLGNSAILCDTSPICL